MSSDRAGPRRVRAGGGLGDALIDPLDRARAWLLAAALTTGPLAYVLRHRARRIEARAALAVGIALGLSITVPALMLALGPIVFGVPHVAAEIRYLVVRRGVPRRWAAGLVVFCLGLSGLRLAEQALGTPGVFARFEVGLAVVATLGAASLAATGRAGFRRLAIAVAVLLGAGALGVIHAPLTRLLFIHLHNFGALVLWLVVFRKRGPWPWVATALLGGALALLLSGATVPWTDRLGGMSALGVDVGGVARWLSPGMAAGIAVPLALIHAFSDSVHYGAWLGLIPEEEARAEGSLTFRMTARSLLADFGALGVGLTAAAMAVVLGASLWNLGETRRFYFASAGFHGYLELLVIVWLFVRGERALSPRPALAFSP